MGQYNVRMRGHSQSFNQGKSWVLPWARCRAHKNKSDKIKALTWTNVHRILTAHIIMFMCQR